MKTRECVTYIEKNFWMQKDFSVNFGIIVITLLNTEVLGVEYLVLDTFCQSKFLKFTIFIIINHGYLIMKEQANKLRAVMPSI